MVVKTAVLKELETLYAKSGNQLCVLYGRPDLEKELLLKTFLQNKKAFYYRARYASPESQKQMMAEALEEKLQVRLQKYDYEEYFNRIKSGGPEKLILVIDEFSYIAKKDTDFINAVLKLKAKKLYPGPVMILLCSSVVSWVEKEMENCIGTDAVKKIDQTIKLSNLNFLEVVRVPRFCRMGRGLRGTVQRYFCLRSLAGERRYALSGPRPLRRQATVLYPGRGQPDFWKRTENPAGPPGSTAAHRRQRFG